MKVLEKVLFIKIDTTYFIQVIIKTLKFSIKNARAFHDVKQNCTIKKQQTFII